MSERVSLDEVEGPEPLEVVGEITGWVQTDSRGRVLDPSNPDQAGDWYASQPDGESLLTEEEEEAYEAINWAMKAIQDMGLSANPEEFALYIHGLQSFVDQHVLHRLDPGYYSNWYTKDEADGEA